MAFLGSQRLLTTLSVYALGASLFALLSLYSSNIRSRNDEMILLQAISSAEPSVRRLAVDNSSDVNNALLPCPSTETAVEQQVEQQKFAEESSLFVIPRFDTQGEDDPQHESINRFFADYVVTEQTGWIDVLNDDREDQKITDHRKSIKDLRVLASSILNRSIACGQPKALGIQLNNNNNNNTTAEHHDPLEYCMWKNDVVSNAALNDFSFEQHLWQWAHGMFSRLNSTRDSTSNSSSDDNNSCDAPGFLDVGVNVGDWISPLRLALPDIPIYGIEGTPHTSAIAVANLRTSIQYHIDSGRRPDEMAATKLLPFALLTAKQLQHARIDGGVCFAVMHAHEHTNIGSQRIALEKGIADRCPPHAAAGATTFDSALRTALLTSSSKDTDSKKKKKKCQRTYPAIYIAKFDIQNYEFRAFISAYNWLMQSPPCYIVLEVTHRPQTTANIEFLTSVVGYDRLWRTFYPEKPELHDEYPPNKPFWEGTNVEKLHIMVRDDLHAIPKTANKDYIFGFADERRCMVETSL